MKRDKLTALRKIAVVSFATVALVLSITGCVLREYIDDTSASTEGSIGGSSATGGTVGTGTVQTETSLKDSETTQLTTVPTVPVPTVTEPTQPAPTVTEPAPTQTQPKPTEPKPTEPKPTEPKPTEPTEPEPTEPDDDAFVRVVDFIPTIRQHLMYGTDENFTGQVIYDFQDAYLRYGTVKKLAMVCSELAEQGIGLLIWDGFRPVYAQAMLWEICPDPTFVSPPFTGNRSHCRGSAVDVTLVDLETGEPLAVPSGFDEFSALGDRDYSDCPADAAANALLLEKTMEKYGFKPYSAEWWHFSDTDTYPVDEYFDPASPVIWSSNCNEYINLRRTPGGTRIGTVPKGHRVELLEWNGKYAKVCYNGTTGYVSAAYIKPAQENYMEQMLDSVEVTAVYPYQQMMEDLRSLAERYPQTVKVESIGTSELGREIPVLRIGDPEAENHVLLQGAIHGREHMTAWLLMAMVDYWLDHGIGSYEDVCFHIIPMVNPDGVTISQTGVLNEAQRQIYLRDRQQGFTYLSETEYARLWKANGLGVDLNRNFSTGWELIDDRAEPSSQLYQGEAPFCAAEARALRDYTNAYGFDLTVSYHATGSLIYYQYGEAGDVNRDSEAAARAIHAVTGYPLTGNSGVDGAGYKDWAIDAMRIPSVTVEIGCSDAPLHERELYSIFVRNLQVLPAAANWIRE